MWVVRVCACRVERPCDVLCAGERVDDRRAQARRDARARQPLPQRLKLERALRDPAYAGRRKIGAFSAASNVTGVRTDVPRLARLLHGHGARCLTHEASVVTEGTKYVLRTDVLYGFS